MSFRPGPGFDPMLSIDGFALLGSGSIIGDVITAAADVSVAYDWEVTGPGPAVVLVLMTFSATGGPFSTAAFKFQGIWGGAPVNYEFDCPTSCALIDFPFMVKANTPSPISMVLSGSVTAVDDFPFMGSLFSFFATLDPTITIDPTFLAANPGYSLIFSSPSPSGGVPEPSAWARAYAADFPVLGGLGAAPCAHSGSKSPQGDCDV